MNVNQRLSQRISKEENVRFVLNDVGETGPQTCLLTYKSRLAVDKRKDVIIKIIKL